MAKKGCNCGCVTIDLIPAGTDITASTAENPAPIEGVVVDPDRTAVGGILLFLKDGVLASLEVFSYDRPLPMPTMDSVRWVIRE